MRGRNEDRPDDVWAVYDGECPLCSSYVLHYRIRASGRRVHLVDARSTHPLVEAVQSRGFDLDGGMVVVFGEHVYWGPDAMNILAILGSDATIFNRLNRAMFGRRRLARLLYPVLVRGRLMMLRLLGRDLIGHT